MAWGDTLQLCGAVTELELIVHRRAHKRFVYDLGLIRAGLKGLQVIGAYQNIHRASWRNDLRCVDVEYTQRSLGACRGQHCTLDKGTPTDEARDKSGHWTVVERKGCIPLM